MRPIIYRGTRLVPLFDWKAWWNRFFTNIRSDLQKGRPRFYSKKTKFIPYFVEIFYGTLVFQGSTRLIRFFRISLRVVAK